MSKTWILLLSTLLLTVFSCAEKPKIPAPKKEKTEEKTSEKKQTVTPTEAQPAEPTEKVVEEEPVISGSGASRKQTMVPFLADGELKGDAEVLGLVNRLRETGKIKTMRRRFEELKGKGSIAALMLAMRSPIANIRSQSALILTRMKHRSKAYTKGLNVMVLSDPDPDVRGVAARAMVFYRSKGTVNALSEAIVNDKAEGVRMHAAWALGAIGDRAATKPLIAALKDDSTEVRLRSVGALKRLKARSAVRAIVGCLDDKNALVRKRAHEALMGLTGKKMGPNIKAWRTMYPPVK